MSNKISVASKNEGKIAEYRLLFAPLGIEVAPYDGPDIAETGRTFEENARLKAEAACKAGGLAALGDDSGIVIRSLGDALGVKSRRFADECGGYPAAFEKIESMLRGKDRDAYFVCSIALAAPGEKTRVFEGRINGFIAHPARGTNGFGYDPIFVANGMGRTFAEIEPEEKAAIDHRGSAFAKLAAYLDQEAKKAAKEPGFAPGNAGSEALKPAIPKPPAPKKKPIHKAEDAPDGEWGEVAKDVVKLKPRTRVAKAKAEAAGKAEEFEIEVEAIGAVKENN